ncbi:hypothetical protein VIGAN_05210200 [Vigna angularis var. angularis]|uniref:Uncharacterized protein n=1 Tax=Vigna angularis var. angularis TaxID=157739 RepID=A0A0S3S6U3_PHAAN|nr:hypothetical protein VIGAN_05210200 [Vigna angularis var. angularis]
MFDSNSNIRTIPLFIIFFCLFSQQHYAEVEKKERRVKRETNQRECSKWLRWILVQRPDEAPSEEEETVGERMNGEERVVSTFRRSFSFQ